MSLARRFPAPLAGTEPFDRFESKIDQFIAGCGEQR